MPRRFDLATVFVFTTANAVLFAVMRAIDSPVKMSACIAGLFGVVAIAQALLSKGTSPREASVAAGSLYLFVFYPMAIAESFRDRAEIVGAFFYTSPIYLIVAYLAGVLVGAVFLIEDVFRRVFATLMDCRRDHVQRRANRHSQHRNAR